MHSMKQLIVIGLLLSACSPSDEQFCTCMEAGEKFDKIASEMLQPENQSNTEKQQEFTMLKNKKEEACKDYQTMSGEEMIRRKADCE